MHSDDDILLDRKKTYNHDWEWENGVGKLFLFLLFISSFYFLWVGVGRLRRLTF